MGNKKKYAILLLILAGLLGRSFGYSSADSTTDKIKELEQKAETYRKLIELKKKQQGTLTSQLSLMEAEEKKLEAELDIKKNELGDVASQVERINGQIGVYEKSMASQRLILKDLVRIYYESRKGDLGLRLIGQENFNEALRNEDNLGETQNKMDAAVDRLKYLKEGLEKDRKELEGKQQEITTLTEKLSDKNEALENSQRQKRQLLTETKGEEAKYQKLLQRVEDQKQELLNIDELSSAGGLSADAYEKPTEGLASTSWFYSQKDSRWANDEIGRSRSLMKDWGCAVTSVAMVFKYYGDSVTPKKLADSTKYFSWDLIKWPSDWSGIDLVSTINHGNINWTKIDSEIKNNHPVIVYIKKSNGRGGHYVVIHHKTKKGKYVVHDPYFGSNIYLDTSRALVGKMGTDSGTVIDQMIIYNK